MKHRLLVTICAIFAYSPLHGQAPTTGQFLFQQKTSGPFTQFGVTPLTNQAFGWDGSKVVMLSPSGGISWGGITGTLASQTDLQTALNSKQSLTGPLELVNFPAIVGVLPIANLPGTVQYTNGILALAGFSSITGAIADGNLSSNVQLKNGTFGIAGFGSITGTLPTANLPSIPDGKLSSNVQLKNGAFALAGFSGITGALPASNVADLSATYLTLTTAAADYQPLDGDLTALAALSGTNNIYYRSAANTWSSVTVGSGLNFSGGSLSSVNSGTVTSVGVAVPGIFSIASSPVTSSGTMTISVANESANLVWAGPVNGSAAVPSFRSLVAADVPDLSATYLTTSAATSDYQPLSGNLTALAATSGTNNIYYRSGTNTWTAIAIGSNLSFSGGTLASTAGGGSVTSVALTLPGIFSLSGSPVTSSGTITGSLVNQSVNTFFAGPSSGSSTTPAFRVISTSDIPDLSATYLTPATAASDYQPLNAGLTSLAGLSGTNNIYYRSAANTWTAVTVGTGLSFSGGSLTATTSGSVSSVGLSLPGIFAVTGSPITSTGTLTATLDNQAAHSVWAGPTTSTAAPTFRALVSGDVPDLSATYLTPATAASDYQPLNANLTSLAAASTGSSLYYRASGSSWAPVTVSGNTSFSGGTLSSTGVTSVALTAPSIFALTGSPITTSGTLALTLNTAPPNQFFCGPSSGSAAIPTFRVIASADIPDLSSTYLTTATAATTYQPLAAGLTSIGGVTTVGKMYYLSATNTWSAVTIGAGLSFTTGTLANTDAGTVTSVGLSLTGGIFTVSGSPVTTSGTLTGTLATQTANLVLAGPTSGSAAAPTFRALVAADIPDLSASYVKLSVANTFTAAQTFSAGIVGTATNDNATAGNIGEEVTSQVVIGGAVSLSSGTASTVTSISLTAGDWEIVQAEVDYHPGTLTTGSYFEQGVSTTTNTLGNQDQFTSNPMALAAGLGVDPALNGSNCRMSLATTTTIYLTCKAGFATSTLTAYGTIRARRVR